MSALQTTGMENGYIRLIYRFLYLVRSVIAKFRTKLGGTTEATTFRPSQA
ncbi:MULTISPECIES: hypothetical protein [unclassified Paenibacillus]|jgi:hypothetical protein|nr:MULTISPECIES: hypothetical protein [unclassified Paenibacillus]MDR9744604.1 hypothetical protein [Paenibacillus taichungensis]NEU63415.1 hypothetical protein [Paenibacillus sp. ALJ109b]QLG41832.1 hypothetical protein HW560_29380 [Paenibacillus sp. E222]